MDDLLADRVRGRVSVAEREVAGTYAVSERFRRLIERELDYAYRLAVVILGDPSEAEDAIQDAAEKAWRGLPRLDDESRAPAWFRKIIVNTCRDRLRRRRRRRLFHAFREAHEADLVVSDNSQAMAVRDQLRTAFERLSADQRIAVVLRYDADLTVPQVANALGIPEGTVKSRLHGALSQLRAAMEQDER